MVNRKSPLWDKVLTGRELAATTALLCPFKTRWDLLDPLRPQKFRGFNHAIGEVPRELAKSPDEFLRRLREGHKKLDESHPELRVSFFGDSDKGEPRCGAIAIFLSYTTPSDEQITVGTLALFLPRTFLKSFKLHLR